MRTVALLCACLAVASPGLARGAAPVSKSERSDAREHAKKGNSLYSLGKYLDASVEFEAAYSARPDAGLLYNAAQSARLGGDLKRARTLYSTYVSFHPDGANLADAKGHLEKLDEQLAAEEAARRAPKPEPEMVVTPAPEQPKPHNDRPYLKKWWFWTAIGGGVVVVGAAITLGVVLGRPAPQWSNQPDIGPGAPATTGLQLRY
ncbi:MAG: hypothetical protein ABI321_15305 [Polyangia bacterium]